MPYIMSGRELLDRTSYIFKLSNFNNGVLEFLHYFFYEMVDDNTTKFNEKGLKGQKIRRNK